MKKTFTFDTDVIKENIKARSEAAKDRAYQAKVQRYIKKTEKKQIRDINRLEHSLMAAGKSFVEARNISTNIINGTSQNTTFWDNGIPPSRLRGIRAS